MTVSATYGPAQYLADGTTTAFGFAHPFFAPSDLVVTLVSTGTDQVVTPAPTLNGGGAYDYTLTGSQDSATGEYIGGGTVTFNTAPSSMTITITRAVAPTQNVSLINNGPFPAKTIEGELDRLTMLVQQLLDASQRQLAIPVTDTAGEFVMLPSAASRAGQYLMFDSSGNATVGLPPSGGVPISITMQPVVDAATLSDAATMLGVSQVVATVGALRALTNTSSPSSVITVLGYRNSESGGGGQFRYIASDTISADNGGTILVDAAGRRWYRLTNEPEYSVTWFGAAGDGVTDDTAAIQAAINAGLAQGASVYIPVGTFLVSATLTATAPLTIRGVNPGIGPGVVLATNASILLCSTAFTTGDVISVASLYSCQFRDFQIAGALNLGYTSACPRTSGAGIHITGTGDTNFGSIIENVAFSGIALPVQLTRCGENTITRANYFQAWANGYQAFYADNGNTSIESSCGQVTENQFFGNPAASQAACMEIHCGYGAIRANKFLGAQFGLKVLGDQPVNIGSVIVTENSFEENTVQSLYVTQIGTTAIASVQIVGNQYSNIANVAAQAHITVQPEVGGSANYLYDIDISDNNFNSHMSGGAATFIAVNAANVSISGNRGTIFAGSAYGVCVEASSGRTVVVDNEWQANGGTLSGTSGYLIQSQALLRDLSSTAFTVALLPVDAQNGSQIYVTDGHATNLSAFNLTVTSGGGGCIAFRMNGAWLTFIS